jgi:hypothetical protein
MISSPFLLTASHFAMRACYYVAPFLTLVPLPPFHSDVAYVFFSFPPSLVYPVQCLFCVV